MIKISETESKRINAKKNIQLKNISVKDLRLIDTDTGEDVAQEVIDALPEDTQTVDFKITVELLDEDEE